MSAIEHSRLRRLAPEWYAGFAFVHWSMTVRDRKTGWLDQAFHQRFREILLHAGAKYAVACPVYCLMPNHMHLLLVGWDARADQLEMTRFFRNQANSEMSLCGDGYALQDQAYDNVLKERDREQDAVRRTAYYIAENPVRSGLAAAAESYPFTGCMVPGYPELDRLFWSDGGDEYWMRFWRIFASKQPD